MRLKKSINAKDIIDYQERKQQISDQCIQNCSFFSNTEQPINLIQQQTKPKQDLNHAFLSKIRESKSKNRRRNIHLTANYHNEQKSMNFQHHARQQKQMNDSMIKIQARIQNYSPFCKDESQSRNHANQAGSEKNYIFVNRQIHKKLRSNAVKSFKLTRPSPIAKYEIGSSRDQKNGTKFVNLNPQINKVKLFKDKQKMNFPVKDTHKMSPYQLSVSKKSFNLIRLKLNSLGEKADEQQLIHYNEISEVLRDNENKKQVQSNLKRMQKLKLQYQKIRGFNKQIMNEEQRRNRSFEQASRIRIHTSQNKIGARFNTMQIRELPKYQINLHSSIDKTNQKQRWNVRYNNSIHDYKHKSIQMQRSPRKNNRFYSTIQI